MSFNEACLLWDCVGCIHCCDCLLVIVNSRYLTEAHGVCVQVIICVWKSRYHSNATFNEHFQQMAGLQVTVIVCSLVISDHRMGIIEVVQISS